MRSTISLAGLNDTPLEVQVVGKVNCQISGVFNSKFLDLSGIHVIENLDLPLRSLASNTIESYNHFRGLEISSFELESPRLLLGQDKWDLIVTRDLREGARNEPVASYTRLGWVVHGLIKSKYPKKRVFKSVASTNISRDGSEFYENDENLHDLIKQHFSLENLGVSTAVRKSKLEERALEILEKTTRYRDGYWETGLLWARDDLKLPNNKEGALARLISLERKLDREPLFAEMYYKEIERLIKEGYAELVSSADLTRDAWYLPHFGIYKIEKPDKVRSVLDAAFQYSGTSLNNSLLSGPDLLNSLFGVLLSFRKGRIGIKGDIKDMFLRVKVIESDQNFQRFLWRGRDRSSPPKEYKMTSLIFGSKSSPCSANYVKNRNADLFMDKFPESANAIKTCTYVDDYLESLDSVDEAKQRIKEVTHINAHASFKMHEWVSNSDEIGKKSNKINLQTTGTEKALGLQWDTSTDMLSFTMRMEKVSQISDKTRENPTKRQVLSALMSFYDPLGFLNPYTIRARILLQDIWRRGTDWDETLDEVEAKEWRAWLAELPKTRECRIPRCLFEFDYKPVSVELHVFCDASEKAYAAVAYSRAIYSNGHINMRIIASKSYVAPLKPLSIPRLELQAALVGARLASSIIKESHIPFNRRIYWTDSRTVLCWIRTDPRSYNKFVQHRLGELDELTGASLWRWVSTDHNPADLATKVRDLDLGPMGLWQKGPEFLSKDESLWPVQPEISKKERELKQRVEAKSAVLTMYVRDSLLPDPKACSKWLTLLRATARVWVASDRFLGWSNRGIEVEDLSKAENRWYKEVQAEHFSREIKCINKYESLPKDSCIAQFMPYLDANGLLRVGGRVSKLEGVSSFQRHPLILHGLHPAVRLLIAHFHALYNHANTETVINELRQSFCIVRLRVTLKTIVSRCPLCQLKRSMPAIPPMAELPTARLAHGTNPFSHCGIDYFGPLTVSIGRRREKRWGVLFTCLTMRAVHLEIADTLSADSTIMAIQRMTARRGQPSVFYSDNGTNLKGACEELKQAVAALDQNVLKEYGNNVGSKWKFIPPAAPHMGGAWESLVKSVKRAIYAILKCQAPREEVLRTVFAEAEHTVNSRPLTCVSSDPEDPEAITPNHLLFGASSRGMLSRRYEMIEGSPRKQWDFAQRLADEFWHRWKKEYLPTLLPRAKWTAENPQLKVGDIVIICDNQLPRNIWRKGIIQEVKPGSDGRVRCALVKTTSGNLTRPVSKLIRLDLASGIN